MEMVQQEVFGPVLTLQTFGEEDEAVELANGTEYGLAATRLHRGRGPDRPAGRAACSGNDLGQLLLRP